MDDDSITNFINHRLIKKMGIASRIVSYINGSESLDFLREYALNKEQKLILADINMHVLNGFEFMSHFEKIQLSNKDSIHFILLTTSTHPRDISKISNEIKVKYLNKPLTEEK